ncbi:hypothetical protein BKA04_000968 [Cryobacterium mesophilum]|uniref:DUF3048 domain-containing protein n=1 Tax=Terrimesophilobacter mesophilus TaxID=433647 RepID=A0A4R8V9X5_9MICO|nr:DUF3048 domain-containing protein [Terrimesophilobacter mesophilus]MBB5632745.1 hypothetical protein [Terrimesophilobacter mesophilus]TFB79543.1 DUF3048 domain-containing protein [Terrimesophilobacter mesophilus]
MTFHRFLGRRGTIAVPAIAVMTMLALVGCAPEADRTPTGSPSPPYVSTYQTPEPTAIAPLRGTTVPAGSLDHASIAAKIDNHWDARPQVGLETTDIVFEELVEGGITRYVAIWQSEIPELLGPVRSIRPMDPDIVSPFGGIICYSGGQQRFVNLMRQTPVYNAIHGQADTESTFFRTNTKSAPHNVLVRAQKLLGQHTTIAAPQQQFAYSLDGESSSAAKDGVTVTTMKYRFSSSYWGSWKWDAARQLWLRIQQDKVDKDSTGKQLTAANVVALRVNVVNDRGVPKTLLSGKGKAWISSGGAMIEGTWSKSSPTSPIRLVDTNGVTIRLAAGNTWFELIPPAGSVSFTTPSGP